MKSTACAQVRHLTACQVRTVRSLSYVKRSVTISSSGGARTTTTRASDGDAAAAAAAGSAAATTAAAAPPTPTSVEIGTAGARRSLKFDLAPLPGRRDGYAVVCVAVEPGSEAEEAGVRAGMRLTAISDPIRRDGMWPVQERPSLKNIRELLRMRCADTITLEFAPWDGPVPLLRPAADGTISAVGSAAATLASSDGESSVMSSGDEATAALLSGSSGSMSSGSGSESIGERLARRYADAAAAGGTPNSLQARQRRRREAMERSEARDDRKFLAGLALAFMAPPLVILAVAQASGYLDALYTGTLAAMR